MFVFDTYAIMEIISGNKNYSKYQDSDATINSFILAELAYCLIRDYGQKTALNYVDKYKVFVKSLDPETIFEAMIFRHKYKKQRISMVDSIGYIMAKKLGIKFLTGDKEFESLENVEFVRK